MILDTNFLIGIDNNHPGAIEKARELEAQGVPRRIPDIVVCELWISIGKGTHTESNRRDLAQVINGLPKAKLTTEISKRAGVIEGTLQALDENGSGVGIADAIIAATALEMEEPVVTDNERDFKNRIRNQGGETDLEVIPFKDSV